MERHPVETPLDKLSNRALDAIEAGDYRQAEKLCAKLLRVYRKAPDGHDRMAMLRMAQGRYPEAIRHYDKLLAMARKDPQAFDDDMVQDITAQRQQALHAAGHATGAPASEDDSAEPPPDSSRTIPPHSGRPASITAGIRRLFRGK